MEPRLTYRPIFSFHKSYSAQAVASSNVLYYDMNDNAWLCIRPSGTEPKIKFYYGIKGTSLEDADAKSEALGKALMSEVDKLL